MALVQTLPADLLLCVFVHGFKGDDSTFLDFPSRLAHNLQETIQNVTVESIVFPAYETKGELKDAVESFVEWLQHQVLQREVSRAIEVGGERGAAGAAKIVLCGHSMGGLVIADALLAIQKMQTDEGPLWPRIIALLAFDTPYLGLHPNMFKHQAEQGLEYASTAHSVVTGLGPVLAGLGALWGASSAAESKQAEPSRKKIQDKSGTNTPSAESGSWSKWAALGGGVLAAGAAATAWYHRDKVADSVNFGWGFITDHFKYVGNLWNEPAMKQRLDSVLEITQKHKIIFRTFYTYLPKKPGQARPRTFIVLPFQSDAVAAHFIAAHNEKAETEIEAHIGMFEGKSNPGYYELGLKTAQLIREAVVSALMESEKTMKVNYGEVFDEEKDLAKNRRQVGQDGREAEATGHPDKPEGV